MNIHKNTMPKRPRPHQLESESRTALRSLIPLQWVFRDKNPDYGVDAEIEIFDEDGAATGLIFFVQLKATDEIDASKALRLRLRNSTFSYLHSLALPVLVVLYHAPSKQIYVHWLHNFDHFHSRATNSYISFLLSTDNVWSASTPHEMIAAIKSFRDFRSPTLPYPINFQLIVGEDPIRGMRAHDLVFGLRKAIERCRSFINIITNVSAPKSSLYRVEIDNKEVEITLAGYPAFMLRTKARLQETETITTFAPDVMICIALALSWYGHDVGAASIISEFVHESKIAKISAFAFPIAICLARANQLELSLEIAEASFKEKADFQVVQAYLMPLLANQRNLSQSVLAFALHILSGIEKETIKRRDKKHASVINYNMANILRGLGRLSESISRYKRAARLDDDYLDRAYFWSELGGILFLRKHYSTAATFYKRSLDLSSEGTIRPFYADALMFSGKYKESQEAFFEYLEASDVSKNAEWVLKHCALRWLRSRLSIDTQQRKASELLTLFCPAVMEDQEIEKTCELILRDDALSQLAWFNIGVIKNKRGDFYGAMMSFLVHALLRPSDYESWRNVIFLSMNLSYQCIFFNALSTTFKYHGNDFLEYLTHQFPDKNELMASLLMQFSDSLTKEHPRGAIQFHKPDIGWDQIIIKSKQVTQKKRKQAPK